MQSKVVYTGLSKNNLEITLRYPKDGDEIAMLDYVNSISREETFILLQGHQYSLDEEKDYLTKKLESISKHKAIQLLAFTKNELLGIGSIELKEHAESHVANFGISIAKEYRNQGIGKILMEKCLEEAIKNLPNLKIITLSCFASNPTAINLYYKMGFKEFGKLPQGLKRKGEFSDEILMFKLVNN